MLGVILYLNCVASRLCCAGGMTLQSSFQDVQRTLSRWGLLQGKNCSHVGSSWDWLCCMP
jgi:hypothetical protein